MDMQTDQTVIDRLKAWWRQHLLVSAELAEIRALDSRQFADAAHDCGVSPSQLYAIVRAGPHGADEMADLMRAMEIDPAIVEEADRTLFRDMQAICATCGDKKQCRYDLEDGRAVKDHVHYCGNAEQLDKLRAIPEMQAAQ